MIGKTLAMMVAVWGWSLLSPARGEETATRPETKPAYHVPGGSCSRSWKLYSRHDSMAAAVAAANKLRSEKVVGRVVVSSGAVPGLPPDRIGATCQVYSRACRTGWQPGLRTADLAEAKKSAEELSKLGRDVEIVYLLGERR